MEESSRLRTGHGPHNNALCNALALALIICKNNCMKKLASTLRTYSGNRDSIFQTIPQP